MDGERESMTRACAPAPCHADYPAAAGADHAASLCDRRRFAPWTYFTTSSSIIPFSTCGFPPLRSVMKQATA